MQLSIESEFHEERIICLVFFFCSIAVCMYMFERKRDPFVCIISSILVLNKHNFIWIFFSVVIKTNDPTYGWKYWYLQGTGTCLKLVVADLDCYPLFLIETLSLVQLKSLMNCYDQINIGLCGPWNFSEEHYCWDNEHTVMSE